MRLLQCLVLLVVVVLRPLPASAFSELDLREAGQQTQWVIGRLHGYLSNHPDYAELVRGIRFRVEPSNAPSAFAGIAANGTREIRITDSMNLLLSYITEVGMLQVRDPQRNLVCGNAYLEMIRERFFEMRDQIARGQAVPDFPAPEEFSSAYGNACGLHRHYPFPAALKEERERRIDAALSLIYFHELAHHALGHQTVKLAEGVTPTRFRHEMRRSRDQEMAADAWAVKQMFALGLEQNILAPDVWQMLVATSGLDVFFEPIDSHPNGLRRMSAAMQQYRELSVSQRGGVRPEVDALIDDTLALMRKIDEQLGPPPELQ